MSNLDFLPVYKSSKVYQRCVLSNTQGILFSKYLLLAKCCKSKNKQKRLIRKANRYGRLSDQYWEQ
jgi:hypothetical protein